MEQQKRTRISNSLSVFNCTLSANNPPLLQVDMQTRTLLTLLAASLSAFASPMPAANGTVALEKRITHNGRVRSSLSRCIHPLNTIHAQGTWYHPGLGNCGFTDNDSSPAVAIGIGLYNQNGGGNCNQVDIISFSDTHPEHCS